MSPCFTVSWTCGRRITEACTPRSQSAIAVTSDTRGSGWRRKRRIVLRGGAPLGHSDSGTDNERTAGTLEYVSDSFDGAFVELAAFRKLRPIVPKRDVKNGIRRSAPLRRLSRSSRSPRLYLSPGCGQRLGARIAARKTEHLVASADKFRDNPGTDESCCTCYKNSHRISFTSLQSELTKSSRPD